MNTAFDENEPEADPVSAAALGRFGIPYLFPYQRLVIAAVLDAVSAEADGDTIRQVVILPTGAGKSLCFQLPSLLCPGPTVVVYPLLGLMADQERRMKEQNIACTVLRGGMEDSERRQALAGIRNGDARMIITNPETLLIPGMLACLKTASIFHFVIDEAHCVAEWGDSFRPAYLGLGEAIAALRPRIVTAFTATASPPVLERVTLSLFGMEPYTLISGNPDRPNIFYEVRRSASLKHELREVFAAEEKPMIVFASSRPGVQLLAEDLRRNFPGSDVRFYHAGLERDEKKEIEAWFMASAGGILCATCAYGMGMDKPNIRTVVHYSPPTSVEAYLQEAGRAGRDGKPSRAILLALPAGRESETHGHGESIGESRKRLFRAYALQDGTCRRSILLQALGSTASPCAGCDVCEGYGSRYPSGHRELIDTLRCHPRRFTLGTARKFLHGKAGTVKAAGFASLESWLEDEIEEGLLNEIALGYLKPRKNAPWKGSLEPCVKRSST